MEEHCIPKIKSPATNNLQQENGRKPRKRWENGAREDAIILLGIRAWKTEAKDREFWRQHIEKVKASFGL
jgi:hypothetical protein